MKKFFILCAITLVALFSCTTPEEQLPEEIINPEETIEDPAEAKSILPDEIQVSSDGAPATKAGVIDSYDATFLGNDNKLKFYWDNGDQIDIFGYDAPSDGYIRAALYEVDNLSELGATDRFSATMRKQNFDGITDMFSLVDNNGTTPALVAIYPAGIVSPDSGQSYYNGSWTDPTNEDPTHYVKMNLPSSYDLDEKSIYEESDVQNYKSVRGMKLQAPMLGLYYLTNGITFYHLEGILKIDFTSVADGVKYFKVTAPGKKINGEYNVPINAKTDPRPCITLENSSKTDEETIEFTYGSALSYSDQTLNHVLYIPLPVGTYDQGISVDVYNGNNVMVGHWGVTSLTINRGTLKYTSSFAVERIINGYGDVINVAQPVGINESSPTKGVAVNFEGVKSGDVQLTYGDDPQYKPKHVYIAGNDNTNVGVVSGNLNASTVDFLGGTYAGSTMTTAANTLNIRKGATVGTITVQGGNAKVSGSYQNIVVAENATADGVSAPVAVTINPTATAIAGTPTVTLNAPSNVVIVKPENSSSTSKTTVAVVVNGNANDSYITVGENVVADITAADNTDVNVDVEIAATSSDADGAITIHEGSSESAEIIVVWDGESKSALTYNESEDVYEIYTAAQLAQFAADVNSGNTYAGKTIRLMSSINLNDHQWTPIGNVINANGGFKGTFDGNGKTISHMNVAEHHSEQSFGGLFGSIHPDNGTTVTIKDLTINNFTVASDHMCGAILGRAGDNGVTGTLAITGCTVSNGTVTSVPAKNSKNEYDDGNQAGGIVGCAYNFHLTITDNTVDNVAITGYRDLGGIAGFMTNATFTGNKVQNSSITQSAEHSYDEAAWKLDMTVNKFVGRRSNFENTCNSAWELDESENTFSNTTITRLATVAQIGDINYSSLVSAIAAATDGATVKLVADIDFSEAPYSNYKWAGSTYNPLEICVDNITLDLNNHTISNMGNCAIVFGKLLAANGRYSNITIKNGTLLAGKTDNVTNSYVLGIAGIGGATIKNVTTNGGINVYTSSTNVVIEDCAINGTKYYSVCAQTGSDVTIKGNSTITKNTDSSVATKAMFWIQGAGTDSDCITTENPTGAFGASSINIEAGSYTVDAANGGVFYLSSGLKPTVTGGTFNFDPTACVADGYEAVNNGDGTWTVQESQGVAQIGEDKYQTLAAAVEAAISGQTIKIINDFTIEGNTGVTIPAGKTITLDLNGKTISQTAPDAAKSYVIWNEGNLTITDTGNGGTLECTINQPYVGWNPGYANNVITNKGTLAIEAGNLVNHSGGVNPVNVACYAIDHYASNTLTVNGGNLVSGYAPIRSYQGTNKTVAIHGGTLTGLWPIYLQSATTLIIDGGTINGPDRGIVYADVPCIVSVSDGTFNYSTTRGFIEFETTAASEGTNASITGGTFSNNPSTWVAAGYESYQDGNVWKIREVQGVAQIGDVTYNTLADAVTAAEDGATIKVIKAGEYSIPAITKTLTFDATVEGVVVNHTSNATAIATIAADKKATFKNITFNLGNSYYHGFGTQNNRTSGELEMDGCHIEGSLALYGVSTLKNCTFTATGANAGYYNIWAVLSDATFDNCTFSNTNRAVNVYDFNHTSGVKNVSFSDCSFAGTAKKKAAINIHHNPDAKYNYQAAEYAVVINSCTTSGTWAASVEDTGEPETETICNCALWMVSDMVDFNGEISVTLDGGPCILTVTAEGATGFEPGPAIP